MIRSLVLSFVLVSPFVVGCGGPSDRPDLFKVTGTVTFNGAPVEGADVTFVSEKSPRSATGRTDANGKFSLSTIDSNDGAVEGVHSVMIVKASSAAAQGGPITEANAKEMMEKNMGMKSVGKDAVKIETALPAKYADAKTSGEKRTVSATEANDFKFDLKE